MSTIVDEAPEASGHQSFWILGKEGDKKTTWNPDVPAEVEAARREWDFLVGEKKYAAFKVGPDGKQTGEKLKAFDPKAGSAILVPAFAGG